MQRGQGLNDRVFVRFGIFAKKRPRGRGTGRGGTGTIDLLVARRYFKDYCANVPMKRVEGC